MSVKTIQIGSFEATKKDQPTLFKLLTAIEEEIVKVAKPLKGKSPDDAEKIELAGQCVHEAFHVFTAEDWPLLEGEIGKAKVVSSRALLLGPVLDRINAELA